MGRPIAAAIAGWLATKPGSFSQPTEALAWEFAFINSPFSTGRNKLTMQQFIDEMKLCGYEPVQRGGHSGVPIHYMLNLPEHQAGSRA